MAGGCPTLNVVRYKQKLLSLQTEYGDLVNDIGRENLRCNEMVVGKILTGVIERIEYVNTIDAMIKSFCSASSNQKYRDVWREFVVIVNGDLKVVHAENARYLQLIRISRKGESRLLNFSEKLYGVISEMDNAIPRNIK